VSCCRASAGILNASSAHELGRPLAYVRVRDRVRANGDCPRVYSGVISLAERARMESAVPPTQALFLAPPLDEDRRQRLPRTAPYHDAIAPELADDLHLYVGMGLALVETDEKLPAATIIEAIGRYLDSKRGATVSEDDSDARLALACAYGHEVCRSLGWAWAHVRRTKRPGIVLLSPDKRYVVAPRALIDAALDTDPRGGTLLSEQLERLQHPDQLPKSEPFRYLRLGLK